MLTVEEIKTAKAGKLDFLVELFTFACLLKPPVSGQLQESYLRKP